MNSQNQDSPSGRPAGAGPGAAAKKGGRRRWPWFLGLAVVLLVVGIPRLRTLSAQSAKERAAGRDAAARAVPVTAATTRRMDFPVYLAGSPGTVMPVKTVTVRSRVDGQLVKIAYQEGQSVREGDLLAELDPRPFEVQLHQAEGQLAKDQAALTNARIDLKRYEALIKDDSIARQQLDTQAAVVNQYEAALKSDQAQVDSAKLNLIYCRITAPISGVVGLRLVDPGNIVHASDANGLVVITQQRPITAVFTVTAKYLPQILPPLRAGKTLAVLASQDEGSTQKLADGTLLAVDNQVDVSTNTIRIKALFPNEDQALYPNQLIYAKLLVDTLRGAVVVPTAALQRGPQSTTYVFVIKADQTVEIRNVDVQLTQGEDTVVRQGLAAGETVVIDGVDKLQAGTRVSLAGADSGSGPRKRAA
ncbi:MAG TPA: MdtA/MuxA family multidrug efflux RND transporter periplasmic adaptor subunit [Terriglobales bacterium]|nr:MdtA/MuxA family multidrug efflux RND transporter periplasmic adaptor subunit [Terriglobales bacterium]